MSKYGSLLPDAPSSSNCKLFLARTLTHHDTTMNHPLMVSIYNKRVTNKAYTYWLRCMLALFKVMEENEQVLAVIPNSLLDGRLDRVAAIKQDLKDMWELEADITVAEDIKKSSPAVREYFEKLFTEEKLASSDEMICHHFLHYNAMLSGGAFLGNCLKKMSPSRPSVLYKFELGKASHEYVRDYMAKLDKVPLTSERQEKMVQSMIQIYDLTERMMDEAQALQPDVLPPESEKTTNKDKKEKTRQPFDRKISLEVLHCHDGKNDGNSTWICIGGRVLDVSSSSSYGPGGPYELFGGHEVSKNLSEMSLEPADLDDLTFDAKTHAVTWATKLGKAYPVMGTLVEFPEDKQLPEEVFDYDPSAAQSLQRPPTTSKASKEDSGSSGTVGGDGNNARARKPGASTSTAAGGNATERCPLTGQEGAACPLGFTNSSSEGDNKSKQLSNNKQQKPSEGECPFPFIFLHDPKQGFKSHPFKTLLVIFLIGFMIHRWFGPNTM